MLKLKCGFKALRGALAAPLLLIFGGGDVGWVGSFVPMIVGEGTLNELRNLAGPPQHPGQRWIMVDLVTGEFKWYTSGRGSSRGRGRRR